MVTLYREYFTVTGIFENSVYDGVEEMLKTLKEAGIKIAMANIKTGKICKNHCRSLWTCKIFRCDRRGMYG